MPRTTTIEENRAPAAHKSRWPAAWWNLLLIAAILGACGIRAYVGLWGSRIYTQDAFSMLDGAWRVLNGQRPHVDFYTGLGPVTYLITAGGMLLSAGNAAGLAYGQALFGGAVGLWCYLLCRPRFGGLTTIVLCPMVALMAIVPTVMGGSSFATTPGAIYNRFGYALATLVMIETVHLRDRKIDRILGGISTGLILGTLPFLKISFFIGAVGLLLALSPLTKQYADRWRGIASGFLCTILGFAWYLRFNLAAMFDDLRTVAHAKHVILGWHLAGDAVAYALPFLLLIHWIAKHETSRREKVAVWVAGVAVCSIGFFLLMTSWQFFGLPLGAVMTVLLLDRAMPGLRVSVLALAGLVVVPYMTYEVAGLGFALSQKLGRTAYSSFTAPPLAGFTSTEDAYVEQVNEGCDLLNRSREPRDTVTALNFSNPFPHAMQMPPSPGGTTWLQYRTNFDESGPPGERIFGDASLVMLPKAFSDRTLIASVPRIYGPYLKEHYAVTAESANWWLYRRKPSKATVPDSR